jgi:recombination protein RecR
MRYPSHLLKLIQAFRKLPGVGNKSAERFAFHLMNWDRGTLSEMAELIKRIPDEIHSCAECGCFTDKESCQFCHPERLTTGVLCVIASPRDAYAIEETREFKGIYQVLGGLLSPLDGIGPDLLAIPSLLRRIQTFNVREVVIALDSTLEGDTTALYIKRELDSLSVITSRLAFGLPMGSSLDYVDGGTLARAFAGRGKF